MMILISIITLIIGYLIGSIMTAVKIAKSKAKDIKECGSGNAGSTNIMRTFGWKWGLICLVSDSMKGALSVAVGMGIGHLSPALFPNASYVENLPFFLGCVGVLGAILGHLLPVFYNFRGGKSVAVALGGFAILAPKQLLIALLVGIVLIAITKMVSVGSVTGTVVVAVLVAIENSGNIPLLVVTVIVALIIIIAHLPNIQRIMDGSERKIENTEWEKKDTD